MLPITCSRGAPRWPHAKLRAWNSRTQTTIEPIRPVLRFALQPIPKVFLITATPLNLHNCLPQGGFLQTAVSDAPRSDWHVDSGVGRGASDTALAFGGRFNGGGRGAWYAAFEMRTAQTEVASHRAAELKEVGWRAEEIFSYIDYLADFRHEFHDIRGDPDFVDCLDPDSYTASQALGLTLLTSGAAGIVYPSVRDKKDGVCIACFRPPLVLNVQEGSMVRLTFIDTEMTTAVVEN